MAVGGEPEQQQGLESFHRERDRFELAVEILCVRCYMLPVLAEKIPGAAQSILFFPEVQAVLRRVTETARASVFQVSGNVWRRAHHPQEVTNLLACFALPCLESRH